MANALQVLNDRQHDIELSPEKEAELKVLISVRNRLEAVFGLVEEVVTEPQPAARAMKALALL